MSSADARAAIVTGAGMGIGGIGRTIAARLAETGTQVMLADLDPRVAEAATAIAAALGERGKTDVAHWAGDLSTEAGANQLVAQTLERFGRIDVLVNNAGSGIIRPFLEHDAESLTTTLARNLWTTLWCCHKVLPHMVKQNHGRIINIGADSLRTGIPQHAGYNAAKGGVIGLMVGLAREFAQYDITVNTVSPCVVNTERFKTAMQANSEVMREFVRVVPKGRGAELAEIADLVWFLARREAGFITGQDLSVNGGSAMP